MKFPKFLHSKVENDVANDDYILHCYDPKFLGKVVWKGSSMSIEVIDIMTSKETELIPKIASKMVYWYLNSALKKTTIADAMLTKVAFAAMINERGIFNEIELANGTVGRYRNDLKNNIYPSMDFMAEYLKKAGWVKVEDEKWMKASK